MTGPGIRAVRIAAWAMVLLLAAVVGWSLITNRGADPQAALAPASIGGPFELTDQTGATVTEAALKGHPSALFFGYTYCPDVCPTTLFEATNWLKALGPDGDKLKFYFVSVDPERDTREQLASYLEAFDPRITGLTGSQAAVDRIAEAYRVYVNKVDYGDGNYLVDHTASVYLLDDTGEFVATIAYEEDPEIVLAKLRRLVGTS